MLEIIIPYILISNWLIAVIVVFIFDRTALSFILLLMFLTTTIGVLNSLGWLI